VFRGVLDANVVVSALIRSEGPSGRILERVARRPGVHAVVSPAILEEYRRSLGDPKVRRHLRLPAAEVRTWVDALAFIADIVPGERAVAAVAADPDDDKYLSAALEGRAEYVVSGDRHLLDVGAHEGVEVVTPREMLELLERAGRS